MVPVMLITLDAPSSPLLHIVGVRKLYNLGGVPVSWMSQTKEFPQKVCGMFFFVLNGTKC